MCHIITLSPLDPSSKDNGIARTFISTTDDLKQLLLNRNFILITLINFLIMLGDYQYFVTSALFSLKLFNAHLSEAGFISGLFTPFGI